MTSAAAQQKQGQHTAAASGTKGSSSSGVPSCSTAAAAEWRAGAASVPAKDGAAALTVLMRAGVQGGEGCRKSYYSVWCFSGGLQRHDLQEIATFDCGSSSW